MRKYIIILVIILLASLAGITFLWKPRSGKVTGGDATFYITNDIHYVSDLLTDHGEAFQYFYTKGDGKQVEYIDEIMDAFSEDISKNKPEVLIISGDLTSNGEKVNHLELAKKLKEIENGGTAVYVVPGNHDILNPYARSFSGDKQYVTDYITKEDFSTIYSEFGYQEAISRDQETLSYLAAPTKEVWLLMLDTAIYEYNLGLGFPATDGRISQNTLDWISECSKLAQEKGATIVTDMHHNILHHSEVIRTGYTLNDNEAALKAFKENYLNLVLSGHIHIQDISSDQRDTIPLYDIVTNALSVNPHQYGILQYNAKDKSFDYSTAKVDVEGWAVKNKEKDENLLRFTEYAEEYFGSYAYNRMYGRLTDDLGLTEQEKITISKTMALLNVRYFAGIENEAADQILNSEGYQLMLGLPESFHSSYMKSIISDTDTDDNHLHIEAYHTSK